MTTAIAKKITMTTLKSFINKNRSQLLINVKTRFDSMEDGVRSTGEDGFYPVCESDKPSSNDLGIAGAWFVGGSRNYLSDYETATHKGYTVSNCCGSFVLAVAK